MKSVIVGTAGHIDHGKTALVKALTGIDADRLEEEKRRGITIDIGFAHLELPTRDGEVLRLGFVDVPGHERFVRNMLAGVGGIDLVLLVVASDEGIKPQTREHFDICRLLSVRHGITVLTKADLVDAETLEVVRLEVEDFLRGSFLDTQKTPIIAVSSLTGAGIEDLKKNLVKVASEIPARDSRGLTRLPVDRVFSMKGFGTVVTGTLISGSVRREDELEVFPRGERVRVRGVQVHGTATDQAVAGQRTALNLAGLPMEQLSRGVTLARPGTFHVATRLDVELTVLPSAKALKDRVRVHFHAHTSETIAKVLLHGNKQISAGETAFGQLVLAEPILLLPGDRFIIRQFSPVVTVGGGVVLDAFPMAKIKPEVRNQFLTVAAGGDPEQILIRRVARRFLAGISLHSAVAETGWRSDAIEKYLRCPLVRGEVIRVGDLLVSPEAISALSQLLSETVARFQEQNPLSPGINRETLREKLGIGPEIFAAALDMLVGEKKLEISGDFVRQPGQGVVMKDEESESKRSIEEAFASAGLKVPTLKEVLAGLKVDKVRAQKIVTLLLRDKVLVKISEDLLFHKDALFDLRQRMVEQKAKSARIDVAHFKDLLGVTRKYAIPLLEYLDREHVTRRVGDERIIL